MLLLTSAAPISSVLFAMLDYKDVGTWHKLCALRHTERGAVTVYNACKHWHHKGKGKGHEALTQCKLTLTPHQAW